MKNSLYKSYDELPLFLNADTVAKVLGIAPSSSFVVASSVSFAPPLAAGLIHSAAPPLPTKSMPTLWGPHEPGFPSLRIGNRIVVPKEKFIQWVEERTGDANESDG